jgi:hypothetical protein
MNTYSTRQAAKRLAITGVSLAHYIKVGKVPAPQIMNVGGRNIHVWTEQEIEHVRKLLPKIGNGRKTRYQKLRDKQKAPAGVPVPHKKQRSKKKK